jgi:hypothetical protein
MVRKIRCPLCGTIVLEKQVNGDFRIQVFELHGLGKGRGFSFELTHDDDLVDQVRAKIFRLYHKFVGSLIFSISQKDVLPIREKLVFNIGGD